MKRFLLFLGAAGLLSTTLEAQEVPTTFWSDLAETSWYAAGETEFSISTAEELAGLSELVSTGIDFADKTIIINSDIDLGAHLWTPISTDYTLPFKGDVEGNNHIISNLYINTPDEDFIGLFGKVMDSDMRNIRLENAYIRCWDASGALVGSFSTNSNMENCHVTGVDIVSTGYNVGGLAGELTTNSTMHRCSAAGSVTGVNQVGGLVGSPWDLTNISECYSEGSVSAEYLAGGIAGFCTFAFEPNRENTLTNCYSRADVTVSIGRAGGIYGGNMGGLIISNCYSTGTASGGELIGGFIGAPGGLDVTNSYWDLESSGLSEAIGGWEGPESEVEITGKITAEMKTEEMADMLNADQIAGPWIYDPEVNDGYPSFEGQAVSVPMAKKDLQFSVFPSVTTGSLTISAQNLQQCRIYSATGKLVFQQQLNSNNAIINVQDLPSGVYLLNVETAQSRGTARIVKQ